MRGESAENRSVTTPGLVTAQEAGVLLRLTTPTVRHKLVSGEIPGGVRLGDGPKAPIRMQRAELDRLCGDQPADRGAD